MDIQRLKERLGQYGDVILCEETIDFKAIQIVMYNVDSNSLPPIVDIIDEEVISTYPIEDKFDFDSNTGTLKIRYKK